MKLNLTLFVFCVLFLAVTSCSKDDDPVAQNELSSAELSFEVGEDPVVIPTGLAQSDDPMAQSAVAYLTQANEMSDFISKMQPPAGATKSSTAINSKVNSGGRTEGDVLVYTWTDGNYIYAYQISETDTKYVFELFWKFSDTSDFVRYILAEETKIKSGSTLDGFLEVYSLFGESEDYQLRYQWDEDTDGTFRFDLLMQNNAFKINIVSNTDNSGSVKYFISGSIFYDISWNTDGSGSWIIYDDEGNISDSGTWS
ncbi:MAG TPA: hypothetical protein PKL31_04165 [Fulvivirga sp.]|nr:hypothetical protein [Fulvivirga sp.]